MTNQEFADVMHIVDPDQSGDLCLDEWQAFLMVSLHPYITAVPHGVPYYSSLIVLAHFG